MESTDPAVVVERLAAERGRLAFDVGANVGQTAAVLARSFDRVVAYEPCAESFGLLDVLPAANVVKRHCALSDHGGWVTLNVAVGAERLGELVTGDRLAFSWGETLGQVKVACSTLDTEVGRHGAPDFVKIDTEGHEVAVLEGGLLLLTRQAHPPRLMVEVHASENEAAIYDLLPHYHFERVDHPTYDIGSFEWANHFYLFGET